MEQPPFDVVFEDNHLVLVNKRAGVNVQGDSSGDEPLVELVRAYIKEKYQKPGNVFCGLIHRLDRPVSGLMAFARTSKSLERMNKQFAEKHPDKTYWAIVCNPPKEKNGNLVHHLERNTVKNKTIAHSKPNKNTKEARLSYRELFRSDRYTLLEVKLETGRHHQIRAQLAAIGCVIKGDLKYGAPRSNPDGSISLHSRRLSFEHPTRAGERITVEAPVPQHDELWKFFEKNCSNL